MLVIFVTSFAYSESSQGYCANPFVSPASLLCSDSKISRDLCCPENVNYYEEGNFIETREECVENYFFEEKNDIYEEYCSVKCCLDSSETDCDEIYKIKCLGEEGTPSVNETCNNAGVNDLSKCMQGCCCYTQNEIDFSEIMSNSRCDEFDGSFDSTITNSNNCMEICEIEDEGVSGCYPECDVGYECINSECVYIEDEDVCDPCEDFDCDGECDLFSSCPIDEFLVSNCNCFGSVCGSEKYCCDGIGCTNSPCSSAECSSDIPCGTTNDEGCPLFKRCRIDNTLSAVCEPRADCGMELEICDTPEDDNQNDLINCQDRFCHDVVCANSEDDYSNCMDRGYFDHNDENWKCCYNGPLQDCNEDGVKDTCGACNCLLLDPLPSPILKNITLIGNKDKLKIAWSLNCEIDFYLYKCEGESCSSIENFEQIKSTSEKIYEDSAINYDTPYCYYVSAIYPNEVKNSDIKCIDGIDKTCMGTPHTNFCVDENNEFKSRLTKRAICDSKGQLIISEDCTNKGEGYMCKGPNSGGQTTCLITDDCDNCGDPFNVFAYFDKSKTLDKDLNEVLCKNLDSCFYDFSSSSVDYFRSCFDVRSCYDYRSKFACEEQNLNDFNNKCLSRNCEWVFVDEELNQGICREKNPLHNRCELCNSNEFNEVFGLCNYEKCELFGDCVYRSSDGLCIDSYGMECNDFLTQTHCTGGGNLDMDISYNSEGKRISGTNEIITRSADVGGIGLCRWDSTRSEGDKCYKDANFDESLDPLGFIDYTPPKTTIVSPDKMRNLNISFHVSDLAGFGKQNSGVNDYDVFFCVTKQNEDPCYPNKRPNFMENNNGWFYKSVDDGKHNVYFYAVDNANNLEVVKKFEVNIVKNGPEITLNAHTYLYEDSGAVLFEIISPEKLFCSDIFIQSETEELSNLENSYGEYFQSRFYDLDDGFYQYAISCIDELGNQITEEKTVRILFDQSIFEVLPTGVLDLEEVDLSLKTRISECRWSFEDIDFDDMDNNFNCQEGVIDSETYYDCVDTFNPTESKTYHIHVACKKNNQISKDKILFVYDNSSPTTNIVDSNDNLFNYFAAHTPSSLNNSLFLNCTDSPRFGFGCNSSFYCLSNQGYCNPNIKVSKNKAINFNVTSFNNLVVCFNSKENVIDGMGGLTETRKCYDMDNVDVDDPIISVMDTLKNHDQSDDPLRVHELNLTDDKFLLSGIVMDPDVSDVNLLNNKLDLIVKHNGTQNSYLNIGANPNFEQEIVLKKGGINTIELRARDRSNSFSNIYSYYISYIDYFGDKIYLLEPLFGVSDSKQFDLLIETYKGADCRYSLIDGGYNSAKPMDKFNETNNQHTIFLNWEHFSENLKQEIFIYCKFDGENLIDEKSFYLSYNTKVPKIDLSIDNSVFGLIPLTIVERPFQTNITVKSDVLVRCKYTTSKTVSFDNMNKFDGFDDGLFNTTNVLSATDLEDNKAYTYYVQCENEALKRSKKEKIYFEIDTSKDPGIHLVSPKSPTANNSFKVSVRTPKLSLWCKIKQKGNEEREMEKLTNYDFISHTTFNVLDGKNDFSVSCLNNDGLSSQDFQIIVDTKKPSTPLVETDSKTNKKDYLSAKWSVNKSITDIVLYNYSIGKSPGAHDVFNWTSTIRTDEMVTGLNLSDKTSYYFNVKAKSEVGLWSDMGYSSILVDFESQTNGTNETQPDLCSNDELNLDHGETDIDCGGPCEACGFNQSCILNSDCISGVCFEEKCAMPSCDDEIKNQDETAVDCGGKVCDLCTEGKSCKKDADCITEFCHPLDKKCLYATCDDEYINCHIDEYGVRDCEEGTDCGGPCEPCPEDSGDVCYVNEDGENLLDSDCDKIPDDWEEMHGLNPNDPDDALLPNNDNPRLTNLEAYKENIKRSDELEPSKDKSSLWLIILIILLIIILLIALLITLYYAFYDKVPFKYRFVIDSYINKIKNYFLNLKNEIFKKNSKKEYYQNNSFDNYGFNSDIGKFKPRQDFNDSYSAKFIKPQKINKPINVKIDDSKYTDVKSTKEMVNLIRKDRNEQIKKQAELMQKSKPKEKPNLKDLNVRKKSLYDKISDSFGKTEETEKLKKRLK